MPRPIIPPHGGYKALITYRKSDLIFRGTAIFVRRFFKPGDRTIGQMEQAARSGKQNIIEGSEASVSSKATELTLTNVAKASLEELLEDYLDYLKRKGLAEWRGSNPRFEQLHEFCRTHSHYEDYQPLLSRMDDEELANMAVCLCHQVDSGLTKYIEHRDRELTTEGGIRERMTAARLGQRETQRETIERQATEIATLRAEIQRLTTLLQQAGIRY